MTFKPDPRTPSAGKVALIASRDLADEPSYYGDDDQTNTKPSQSAFTGQVMMGTSAARHGFPRSLIRTEPSLLAL